MRTGALRLIWSNPKTSQNPSNLKPCGEIFLFGMFAQTLLLFLIFDSLSKNLGSASIDSVFDPCHVHVIEILAHRHICLAFVGWAMKHDFFFLTAPKNPEQNGGDFLTPGTLCVLRVQGLDFKSTRFVLCKICSPWGSIPRSYEHAP